MSTEQSMAEREQILRQSDIYKMNQAGNVVMNYLTDNGEALLFKDGSTLEYADEYQAGTVTDKPNKELRISFNKIPNDSKDKAPYVLTILDQTNSKIINDGSFNSDLRLVSIDNQGLGYSKETDEQLFPIPNNLNGNEVDDYLNEIGLNAKKIKSIVAQKNDEYANRSVLTFLKEKINDVKSELTEKIEVRRERKNRI